MIPLIRRLAISPLPIAAGWYAIPIRLIVGYGFFSHGWAKLARGPDNFAGILHAMGMPTPLFLSWATVAVEIIGGLMVLAGALVPLMTVPMIVVLLVAIFTVHLPNGFSSIKLMSYDAAGAHFGQPGYETDLLYIAGLIALCIGGAGPLSLDERLGARRRDEGSNIDRSRERHRGDADGRWSGPAGR
ncbi:DoxX family protein [Sphingomonas quercus]|uniref:DoxX family protein n=1 Tax=Sphingomonas quercus TaxID=2842451 RepID=A0ABS6BMF0_9SPHN|nr:DoxX family protein [Sphingomonas quercus]MBU3079475.1 DoxX family protein [Sphingomonas quercus]